MNGYLLYISDREPVKKKIVISQADNRPCSCHRSSSSIYEEALRHRDPNPELGIVAAMENGNRQGFLIISQSFF